MMPLRPCRCHTAGRGNGRGRGCGWGAALEAYQQVGLGGVEITPIYGVRGFEDRFVPYLSPQWLERLEIALTEARRLGLGVDTATGTGGPFGGPWVGTDDAGKTI